jgi:hypothetical protein
MDNTNDDKFYTKKILIMNENEKNKTIKQINYEKEIKMRVETKTWGLNKEELSHDLQLQIMNILHDDTLEKNRYSSKIIAHIKTKINSYKQQDIIKKRFNEELFTDFEEIIYLLKSCEMKCHYCSQEVYILYERVREMKQWSLDRINNDIGHNKGNLVVACLECNLKRRRTNKDAFMFTKNLVITREGI